MRNPWTKFYWSDWLGGTSGLTAAERGVYITMLALIYENGSPVRFDLSPLARRCGLPAGSFQRVFDSLVRQGKLTLTDDGFVTNLRAEHELGVREIERTKRQSGAHKTNAILSKKRQQDQWSDERSSSASCAPVPEARSQIPEKNPLKPPKGGERVSASRKSRRGRVDYPPAFEELWRAYPDRPNQSKEAAFKAWSKFDDERRAGAVMAAPMFAAQCREQATEPRFIPHCSKWLNDRRFDAFVVYDDDAPTETRRGNASDQPRPSGADSNENGLSGPSAAVAFGAGKGRGQSDTAGLDNTRRSQGNAGVAGVLPADRNPLECQGHHRKAHQQERRNYMRDAEQTGLRNDGESNRRHEPGQRPQDNSEAAGLERRTAGTTGQSTGDFRGPATGGVAIPTPPPVNPSTLHRTYDLQRRQWRTRPPQRPPGQSLADILNPRRSAIKAGGYSRQ